MVHPCPHEGNWNTQGGPSDNEQDQQCGTRSYGGSADEAEPPSRQGIHLWPKTLEELLVKYPCCPPDAFFSIREFYSNPNVNHLDDNCKKVRVVLRNWTSTIRQWSVRDFFDYYSSDHVSPYWNAYARTITDVYYDVNESVRIANELLDYQFESDTELIVNFLTDVYNICDKKIPKLNSMCVVSPPSAGKNFFFDSIAAYFINYGMYGTANKTNNFTWSDGAGKRLVLWNEPNYESYHIEKMKEILGGDTTRVHVKYKPDQPLQGPPVFILTNTDLNICRDVAFADRLKTYAWRAAPILKKYDKKLNPLFFYHILHEHNIID